MESLPGTLSTLSSYVTGMNGSFSDLATENFYLAELAKDFYWSHHIILAG